MILGMLTVFILILWIFSSSIGSMIGKTQGQLTGKAIGSLEGITTGRTEGAKAGKEEGLSAQDTTVEIGNTIQKVGNLEVLEVSTTLIRDETIGNDTYKELSAMSADLVFFADLSKAAVNSSEDGSTINIQIPEPIAEIYPDQEDSLILAQAQKASLSVTAEEAYDAALNSFPKTIDEAKERIENYDFLEETAEETAIHQVENLASAVCGSDKKIVVTVEEGEQ